MDDSGRNKREQGKNTYKDVKMEEIDSSSESSYPGLKKAESTGRKGLNDSEAETSSVPEFTLTIKKSYLLFLVREKHDMTRYNVKLVCLKRELIQ